MSENKKPCGNFHPLPCGIDVRCGYLDREKEIQSLIVDLREEANEASEDLPGSYEFLWKHHCANRISDVMEDTEE